ERREPLLATELRVDPVRANDVIAVRAARCRRENRREVEMADPELGEVRDDRGGGRESELRTKLEPVGRQRRAHRPSATVRVAARALVVSPALPQASRPRLRYSATLRVAARALVVSPALPQASRPRLRAVTLHPSPVRAGAAP